MAGRMGAVEVDSAGTAAYHVGNPPDPRTVAAAARRGYDLSPLRARKVTRDDFNLELWSGISSLGTPFTTADTATVLRALAAWGHDAVGRFRGMFAFGFVDTLARRVILARDPLGIKPLYAARISTPDGPQVIFASEPVARLSIQTTE